MKKLLLLSLLSGSLALPSATAFSQGRGTVNEQPGARAAAQSDIAEQPCDPQYWRQMSAKAWLESEREIMQNQNLIFKPDSVLEYTCFDQFVGIASGQGGDIFVHTDYFGPKIINRGTTESMETALNNVVFTALSSYKTGSFSHDYLGGRSGLMNGLRDNTFEPPSRDYKAYACSTMSDIWRTAKCSNFIDNEEFETTDGFYPFEAIKKHSSQGANVRDVAGYADTIQETRRFPQNLSCAGGNGLGRLSAADAGANGQGAAGTWSDQLILANNTSENLYNFQTPLGEIFNEVGEKLEPGNCSGGQTAIRTGVTVIIAGENTSDGPGQGSGGGAHPDGVCTNPGCSYTRAGTCVATGAGGG